MNILDEIIAHKIKEVAWAKDHSPLKALEQSELFLRKPYSLTAALRSEGASGIIAEFKRKSPSKGSLNPLASPIPVSSGYIEAGVSALSILTDQKFFGGENDDVRSIRAISSIPILRKDFIIDQYQVAEAKAIGADVILLIAAVLDPAEAKSLARFAHSLGLEVLLEVHDREELERMLDVEPDLIGVNNRNLKTFEVNVDTSRKLAAFIPDSVTKISESGISDVATIHDLREYGFQGFLMGERFMKATDPGEAAEVFINSLRKSGKAKA